MIRLIFSDPVTILNDSKALFWVDDCVTIAMILLSFTDYSDGGHVSANFTSYLSSSNTLSAPLSYSLCNAAIVLLAYDNKDEWSEDEWVEDISGTDEDEWDVDVKLSESKDLEFDSSPLLLNKMSQGSTHYTCGIIYLCCV